MSVDNLQTQIDGLHDLDRRWLLLRSGDSRAILGDNEGEFKPTNNAGSQIAVTFWSEKSNWLALAAVDKWEERMQRRWRAYVVKNSPASVPKPCPSELMGVYPTRPVENTAR
jgi:hypothetical protein